MQLLDFIGIDSKQHTKKEYCMNNLQKNKKQFIINDVQKKLEWLHNNTTHNVAGIFVQGSNNYNLDLYTKDYQSDIDTKAIIIPSLDDVIYNKKPVSTTYVMDDDSHIEVKDIRLFLELWNKANPTYLEILFTDYYIIENKALYDLLDMKNDIAQMNIPSFLKSVEGNIFNKKESMLKLNVLNDRYVFSYNRKDFHHILRLYLLEQHFLESKNFKESMVCYDDIRNLLLYFKKQPKSYVEDNSYILIWHIIVSEHILQKAKSLTISNQIPANSKTYNKLKETIYSIVKAECIKDALSISKIK